MSERIPSFRHLRVFDAIAQCKNFSRGAAAVHLSQPAATQAILNLEKWATASLFYRNKGGTYLTEEGAVLQEAVLRMFDRVEKTLASEVFEGSTEKARFASSRIKSSHVKVLRAISEFSSLEMAANSLKLSRPAVQRIARDFEMSLGIQLFERTPRGVCATPLGSRISQSFQQAAFELSAALDEIALLQQRFSMQLFIGAQPLCSTSLLAASINDLLVIYPQMQVRIIEGSYHYLLNELQNGRIDMMFGALKRPEAVENVREIPLFQEPYCVAARMDHPLMKKRKVTLKDIAACDWVLSGPSTQRRRTFELMFKNSPVRPTTQIEATSVSAQIAFLASSNRLALLTPLELEFDPHMGKIGKLDYDTGITRIPDGLTVRAEWKPSGVQGRFVACLRNRIVDMERLPEDLPEDLQLSMSD